MVANQQDLTVTADRKPLDGHDPELFDAGAAELIGRLVVSLGEPPVDLVHIAKRIDADFHGIQRAVIFGIEKPRMVIGHDRSPAIAAHACAREFDDAVSPELRCQIDRIGSRQQHGVAEMHARALGSQHR
jgi:hypothetical protein